MSDDYLAQYVDLIDAFVAGSISATEFESRYLQLYKSDPNAYGEEEGVLFDLFTDVDVFVADPALRDEGDLDEDQLWLKAREAQEKLRAIASQRDG